VERIIVGSLYAEVPLGLYVVRGENVVLLVSTMLPLPPGSKFGPSAWACLLSPGLGDG